MEYRIKISTASGAQYYLAEYNGKASKFTKNAAEAFSIEDEGAMEIMADDVCNTFDDINGDPIAFVYLVQNADPA